MFGFVLRLCPMHDATAQIFGLSCFPTLRYVMTASEENSEQIDIASWHTDGGTIFYRFSVVIL